MRVDHTSIWVSDLANSERAYESILGISEIWRNEYEDGTIEAFARGEDGMSLQLMYTDKSDVTPEPDNLYYITVEVPEVGSSIERIRSRDDCELLSSTTDTAADQSALFADPDGYRFKLIES